jgi:truncated hemoglobin YjbI
LGGDGKIRAVLTTFYQKVYADAQLAPFFERVTINRIIGKQFAFLKQNIVGDQVFLGEQPKNSHHWMVISNALFQHRMDLMRQALQEHDISDELIDALEQYELQFKTDIVKSEPWLKQVGDLLVDTEQYEECQLDEATVCDYCGAEIARYSMVRFHKRLGKLACQACTV